MTNGNPINQPSNKDYLHFEDYAFISLLALIGIIELVLRLVFIIFLVCTIIGIMFVVMEGSKTLELIL